MGTDAVTEIVGFINNDQIVVTPIQARQIGAVGFSAIPAQIRMIQYLVIQAVGGNRVIDIIVAVCIPVVG